MILDLKVKVLDSRDKQIWDQFVSSSPVGTVYHLWNWGELQKNFGYKPLRLGVIENGKLVLACQVLLSKKPFLGTFATSSFGPIYQDLEQIEQRIATLIKFFTTQTKIYDFSGFELTPLFLSKKAAIKTKQLAIVKKADLNLVQNLQEDFLSSVFQQQNFKVCERNYSNLGFISVDKEIGQLLNKQPKTTRRIIKLYEDKAKSKSQYFEFNLQNETKYQKFLQTVQPKISSQEFKKLSLLTKFFEKDLVIAYLSAAPDISKATVITILSKQTKLGFILGFYPVSEASVEQKITFFWDLIIKFQKTQPSLLLPVNLVVYLQDLFDIQTIQTNNLVLQLNPLKYSLIESINLLKQKNFVGILGNLKVFWQIGQTQLKVFALNLKNWTKNLSKKYSPNSKIK